MAAYFDNKKNLPKFCFNIHIDHSIVSYTYAILSNEPSRLLVVGGIEQASSIPPRLA